MRRIITKAILDMETMQWVYTESFPYNGKWDYALGGIFGGATSGEKGIAKDEADFMQNLQNEQATQFANEQEAQQQIQQAWSPIIQGGPYQYGFSTAEDQQLQQNIENQGAEATANTVNAAELRQQQQSGGASAAPSGASAALAAQVAETGAQKTAAQLGQEKELGYQVGRENFQAATGAEENVAQLANPTGYAGQATSAGQAALGAQQAIQTANANSLTAKLLGGVAGNIGPAAASALPGLPGAATIMLGA